MTLSESKIDFLWKEMAMTSHLISLKHERKIRTFISIIFRYNLNLCNLLSDLEQNSHSHA